MQNPFSYLRVLPRIPPPPPKKKHTPIVKYLFHLFKYHSNLPRSNVFCRYSNDLPLFVFSDITYMNISDAAKVGDLETLKSSFARGISPDQRDKYYKTPLMAACAHGNIDVAKYLLQIG